MAFAGGIGAEIDLQRLPRIGNRRNDYVMFSESNGRLIAEVPYYKMVDFERHFSGLPVFCVGNTTSDKTLTVWGTDRHRIVYAPLSELKEAWQAPLRW